MGLHVLINKPLPTEGLIKEWVLEKDPTISKTIVYQEASLPKQNDSDMLIILGGTMGAYEGSEYP